MKLNLGARMSFYKKVLVLKQTESGFSVGDRPISGICRIEIENGVGEIHLTVVNILPKSGTDYKFMLVDGDKNSFVFDCGKRPSSQKFILHALPNLNKGVAAGLYAVNGDIPLTVAYSGEDNFDCPLFEFKRLVAERCLADRKAQEKILSDRSSKVLPIKEPNEKTAPINDPAPVRPPYPPAPEPDPNATPPQEFPSPKSKTVQEIYDDEAVATANYYAFDDEINQRLSAVKEWDDERIRLADGQTFDTSKKEADFGNAQSDFFKDETDAAFGEEYSEKRPYFRTVEKDLNGIFAKFPEEKGLYNIFPQSKWARINYSKEKFYVVGLIKENKKEKYICYGVPGVYSTTPPKELKGYCTFIPLSIFDLSGDGFWMMFQDAVTGDCIKPKPPFD